MKRNVGTQKSTVNFYRNFAESTRNGFPLYKYAHWGIYSQNLLFFFNIQSNTAPRPWPATTLLLVVEWSPRRAQSIRNAIIWHARFPFFAFFFESVLVPLGIGKTKQNSEARKEKRQYIEKNTHATKKHGTRLKKTRKHRDSRRASKTIALPYTYKTRVK